MKETTKDAIKIFVLTNVCFWIGWLTRGPVDERPPKPEPSVKFTIETNPPRDAKPKVEERFDAIVHSDEVKPESSHVQLTDYQGKVWVLQKGYHIKAILPTDQDRLTNGCIVQITQPPYLRDYVSQYSITFAESADVVAKKLGVLVEATE